LERESFVNSFIAFSVFSVCFLCLINVCVFYVFKNIFLLHLAPTPQGTGHVLPLLQIAGHGTDESTTSRRTANTKLTTLNWPSRKRSQKRLILLCYRVVILLESWKKWRGTTKQKIPPDVCFQFQIRFGVTVSTCYANLINEYRKS